MDTDTVKKLLRLLVRLAREDGEFHPQEEKFIRSLGEAHHLAEDVVTSIMTEKVGKKLDFSTLSYEERFEILYNLIIMMKVDNEVMNEELFFIQKIAPTLGFQQSAIMELYPHAHANLRNRHQIRIMQKNLRGHLVAKKKS